MYLLNKKNFLKLFFFFCVFSYFYQIHYKYIPGNFACILGLLGIGYYFSQKMLFYSGVNFKLIISRSSWNIFSAIFIFFIVSLFSVVLNSTSDLYFQKFCILNVLYFFAAYFLMILARAIYKKVSIELLVKYLSLVAIVQIIVSFCMFLNTDLQEGLNNLLAFSSLSLESIDRTEGSRLVGFGTAFFQSGIIHGFILILFAMVVSRQQLSFIKTLGIIGVFIFVSLGGLMLARTIAVGIILAFILLFSKLLGKKTGPMRIVWNVILSLIIIISGICLAILSLPLDIQIQIFTLLDFALEFVNNYLVHGSLETSSTDVMFDMYIFPSSIKTWLLGDAYWNNPLKEGYYYMGTDIGFCRMLFYFGLLGLLSFIAFQGVFIYQTYLKDKKDGVIPFMLLFLYVLILNLKGFADLFYLLIPCYFFFECSNAEIES